MFPKVLKLVDRHRLIVAYASGGDFRDVIILRSDWNTGQAAQDRDLSYVRKSVGDGRLQQLFSGSFQRSVRSKILIERFQRGEETIYFLRPRKLRRLMPLLLSARG